MKCMRCGLILAAALGPSTTAASQGHGPAYGLSTPTLGRGGWSVDVAAMSRRLDDGATLMLRPMLSYGITEDVQLSASLPLPLNTLPRVPNARGMARMPAAPDAELLLGWRFHRQGTDVGTRFETTTWVGVDYPTDQTRAGITTSPGLVGSIVTGYASRTLYLWAGSLHRRYIDVGGDSEDHLGDVTLYSLVAGYRPPMFQRDYPHPDWRIFVEVIGEHSARTVVAGERLSGTGGHQIFVGPTLLGLFGSWGVSGGPVFNAYRDVNGSQPGETMRLVLNTTLWF